MANSSKDSEFSELGGIIAFATIPALVALAAIFTLFAAAALAPFVVLWWLFRPNNRLAPNLKVSLAGICGTLIVLIFLAINGWLGLVGFLVVGGSAALWYANHPWRPAKQLHDELRMKLAASARIPPNTFPGFLNKLTRQRHIDGDRPVTQAMLDMAEEIYREDYTPPPFPDLPPLDLRYDRLRLDRIGEEARAALTFHENEEERAARTFRLVGDLFEVMIGAVPDVPGEAAFQVPLYRLAPDVRRTILDLVFVLVSDQYQELKVGDVTLNRYLANCDEVTSQFRSEEEIRLKLEMDILEHPGTPQEIVEAYLTGTSLRKLLRMPVAFGVPEHLRTEHGVIVAGSGGGKTQLLESLMLADLDDEARPGVILIDSKGEMIERIARLAVFDPNGGPLRDQLIIIDHKDKPALNMFDMDEELVNSKINEVASLMRYFFGGLFGSQLSDQMDVLFLPLLHMILRMPGATLHTFAALVDNPQDYPEVLESIPQGPRSFILNHYNDRGYAQTKTGIITRLHRIINEVTLDEMFSAPNNAVNIGQALNEGKIILVSTDADGLQDLSPIFGKYVVAQVMNAGLARGSRQRVQRRPIHFYIDECAPYVDDKLAQMLTTIRSYGIGVMMAFQGQWQMKTYTPVILGNTAIKIMGSVEDNGDAKAFANSMRTSTEFIMAQRKQGGVGRFACYTRDLPSAIPIELPFGRLDHRKQMPQEHYERLRQFNRLRLMAKNRLSVAPVGPPKTIPMENAAPPAPLPLRARRPPRKNKIDPDAGERTNSTGDWEP